MDEMIFLNGKFVDKKEANLSVFDPGFLYGRGLFETMRAYNGEVFRPEAHLKRLFQSLSLLRMKFEVNPQHLKDVFKASLKKNNLKSAYLRLTVWQALDAVHYCVLAKEQSFFQKQDYARGFRAIISSFKQNEESLLCGIKSLNFLQLLLAYQEAKDKNVDEALLLNTRGFIAEGSRSNIFIVKDNLLITPALSCGCLPGITRDTVFRIAQKEKIKIEEAEILVQDLRKSDEAFLTNSLVEVMPLVEIDGRKIKNGAPGKITLKILERYRKLVGV